MRGSLARLLLVYGAICPPATGFLMQEISYCGFEDKQGNVTFQYAFTFNRLGILGFNCAENKFVTYLGLPVVDYVTEKFNNSTMMLNYMKTEQKRCKDEREAFWDGTVERSVKPSMEVFFPEQFNGESLPVLICHVWGFYPQDIVVAWIKNDKTVVKNETQAVRSGDWTYQVVAKVDLRDSLPEDNYSCVVKHQSLPEPMVKTWKAGLSSSDIIMISVSAVVFAVGLISLVIGVTCWRGAKRSDDGHFLATISCPWRHLFAPCLSFSLFSLSRERSVTNLSTSSLLSCDSQSLLEEERDLGEDSEMDSIEGQLVRGEIPSTCATSELLVPFYQGCALEGAVRNVEDDRRCFPI